jgi:Right handed beta helix region
VRILLLLCLLPLGVVAADYYVAPGGNDAAPGTLVQPWRTVQKAADSLAPGDRVLVRAGTYDERVTVNVSGSAAGGYITFENYPGETPIITSSEQPPIFTDNGLFFLPDCSYVVVEGFELASYKATGNANNQKRVPAGIFIRGASSNIEIRDCKIHDIWNDFRDGNAFGIAVYGDTTTPIDGIIIDGCEIYDCRLGNSESLAINGNVTNFAVTNNLVHDNNNIGIVAIGYEKTCCGGKSHPLLIARATV